MDQYPTKNSFPSCAFIIPHYAENFILGQQKFLSDTLKGLFAQTDQDWHAIIVDDASPSPDVRDYLFNIKENYSNKIDVVFLEKNVGPGICRNIGIQHALKQNASFIIFNDADDISHPERVAVVKNIFQKKSKVGLIYSTFHVIDENNIPVPTEKISSPILEIMESHSKTPLEGKDVWIRMGIETGYTNKTSSTAVRATFAHKCPFVGEKASEDFHTWMRMSASGAYFKYASSIPTKYRIPSFMKYQASRTRIGPSNFNKIKARVDADGFSKSVEIAIFRNRIKPEDGPMLKEKFFKRLAKSMLKEGETELANELLDQAHNHEIEGRLYQQVKEEFVNV